MPKGITQAQVDDAADALLAAGENPTVEKVRAALGTGSPNTVTRMLDTWRNQIGRAAAPTQRTARRPGPCRAGEDGVVALEARTG